MTGELKRRSITPTADNEIVSQLYDKVTKGDVDKLDKDIALKNPGSQIQVNIEAVVKAEGYSGAITYIKTLMVENLKK